MSYKNNSILNNRKQINTQTNKNRASGTYRTKTKIQHCIIRIPEAEVKESGIVRVFKVMKKIYQIWSKDKYTKQ